MDNPHAPGNAAPQLSDADHTAIAAKLKGDAEKEIKRHPWKALGIVAVVVAVIVAGIGYMISMGDKADKVQAGFFELVAHLPTIALVIVIALAAVYVFNCVRNLEWFDRRGAAREVSGVCERFGGDKERQFDPIALAIAYSGNAILAGLVAAALLLHFG